MVDNVVSGVIEDTVEGQAKSGFTVTLPETNDAVEDFWIHLAAHRDVRGVITLSKNYHKMVYHQRLANGFREKAESTVCYINGERSKNQRKGDGRRSLRATATAFYNSLNTAALRMQCQLFELNFDDYSSIEDIVETLVARHLEMVAVS